MKLGTVARKNAEHSPACEVPRTSFPKRYATYTDSPLTAGPTITHTSRMSQGRPSARRAWYAVLAVNRRPG